MSVTPIDGLLLLMVLIWGGNFTVVKSALQQLTPLAFNAIRLLVASAVFLAAISWTGLPRFSRREWAWMALLGVIGHFVYQMGFLGGLARTTASNSSLILGCSPVAVALVSAVAGHERIGRGQWAGVFLSVAGIYLVVGTGARFGGASLVGDLLTFGAAWCWAIYTVGCRSLLTRYSPLAVTGLTMAVGTLFYLPMAAPDLARLEWSHVPMWAWVAVVFSGILALNVSYLIWYTAVQRIGNLRTSVYSNVTPVVAMSVAAVVLGEPITIAKIAGAAAILGGVAATRAFSKHPAPIPAEE
ncbi:MAG: DMT family transporter [Acidobacteriota bacterium]